MNEIEGKYLKRSIVEFMLYLHPVYILKKSQEFFLFEAPLTFFHTISPHHSFHFLYVSSF